MGAPAGIPSSGNTGIYCESSGLLVINQQQLRQLRGSADSMFTHISNSLLKQDPRPEIEEGTWICEQPATASVIRLPASVRRYLDHGDQLKMH